jgi:hypothetical protein
MLADVEAWSTGGWGNPRFEPGTGIPCPGAYAVAYIPVANSGCPLSSLEFGGRRQVRTGRGARIRCHWSACSKGGYGAGGNNNCLGALLKCFGTGFGWSYLPWAQAKTSS